MTRAELKAWLLVPQTAPRWEWIAAAVLVFCLGVWIG